MRQDRRGSRLTEAKKAAIRARVSGPGTPMHRLGSSVMDVVSENRVLKEQLEATQSALTELRTLVQSLAAENESLQQQASGAMTARGSAEERARLERDHVTAQARGAQTQAETIRLQAERMNELERLLAESSAREAAAIETSRMTLDQLAAAERASAEGRHAGAMAAAPVVSPSGVRRSPSYDVDESADGFAEPVRAAAPAASAPAPARPTVPGLRMDEVRRQQPLSPRAPLGGFHEIDSDDEAVGRHAAAAQEEQQTSRGGWGLGNMTARLGSAAAAAAGLLTSRGGRRPAGEFDASPSGAGAPSQTPRPGSPRHGTGRGDERR